MRVARRGVHSSRGAGAGRAGGPGLTTGPNEVLTERPGVLALGTSSWIWASTTTAVGALSAKTGAPGAQRRQGTKHSGAVHMSRASGARATASAAVAWTLP